MSLLNAAAGFGAYCLKNNVFFKIPLFGLITIGAQRYNVTTNFIDNCQRRFDVKYSGKQVIYTDEAEEIVRYSTIGEYISGFKFNCAASQIPKELIYTYKGKSYLTNINIEGHMIWIKNMDEIKLKEVTDVPCVKITLDQLGCQVQSINKESTQKFISVQEKLNGISKNRRSVAVQNNLNVTPDIKPTVSIQSLVNQKDKIESSIHKLSNDLWYLRRKINKLKDTVKNEEERYNKALDNYKSAINKLNNTYSKGWNEYDLQNLIDMGKVRKDKYGAYELSEGSQVATFYTEEDAIKLENTSYPEKGADIVSSYHYSGSAFKDTYTVAHHYKKKVAHKDRAYICAMDWCNSRSYKIRHEEVVRAYRILEETKEELDKAKKEWNEYSTTPEYVTDCTRYTDLKNKLDQEKANLANIESKIYKN